MNDERYTPAIPHYDLENKEIDWSSIGPEEIDGYKWGFAVPDRETGRRIALEFCHLVGNPDVTTLLQNTLENSQPITDLRLDGSQISFSEYDEDFSPEGDIKVIEIYLRDDGDEEYYAKYKRGIDGLLAKIQGEGSAIQSEVKEILNEGSVHDILADFRKSNVFGQLRASQATPSTFFDPASGYIEEDDTSDTGNVLNMFLELLEQDDPVALKGVYDVETKHALVEALMPGSGSRRVLLAYYGVDEATPWTETADNIADAQAYKKADFPTPQDIQRIIENLG